MFLIVEAEDDLQMRGLVRVEFHRLEGSGQGVDVANLLGRSHFSRILYSITNFGRGFYRDA